MKIIRNIFAVIIGCIIGSIANMGIISISSSIIPPPEGADVTTMEGLLASIHLFEPKHFIMPFLAHAVGVIVGAFLGVKIAASHNKIFAFVIGGLFMAGGIINVFILPSPTWFNITDLFLAYIPMAWIGWKLAGSK